jgi:hypothetical protein
VVETTQISTQAIDDGLVDDDYWLGTGQFTYSVPGAGATWSGYAAGSEPFNNYSVLSAAQGDRFRAAIQLWDTYIAPDFTEVTESGGTVGTIRAAFSGAVTGSTWGYAYSANNHGGAISQVTGDIWISPSHTNATFAVGTYDWMAILHEAGHAIGLKHPFEAPALPSWADSTTYTLMAYDNANSQSIKSFSKSGNSLMTSSEYVNDATPMVFDIAAVQLRYGAETSTAAGNDTYTFSQATAYRQSIYDAGGTDTFDASAVTRNSIIDLRPGQYSSIGIWTAAEQTAYYQGLYPGFNAFIASQLSDPQTYTWTHNVGLAFSTTIENAIGGAGNDVLVGNTVANRLTGGAGNDLLLGGTGTDTAVYSQAAATSILRTAHGMVMVTVAGAGTDRLKGVETLEFAGASQAARPYALNDANGDSDSDLIYFSNSTGTIGRRDFTGGTPGSDSSVGNLGSGSWDVEKSGDFNRDGTSDLVLKNAATGQFYVWTLSSGVQSGGFNLGVIGTNWDVTATGDFNRDGNHDLLWRNSNDGHLYIWSMDAAGHQVSSTSLGVLGVEWSAAGVADFDADGDSDVLLRNSTNGYLYLFEMENSQIASGHALAVFGSEWAAASVGDYNSDGYGDIFLKNTSTGLFYSLSMDSGFSYYGINFGTIGTDWTVANSGDYNADGTDDLLWRNSSSGLTYLWAMQDGLQAATGSVSLGTMAADLVIV